mgnify:CR=1 FL=1
MGKFKYSMQNILDIKIKLETQAKNEFSEANRAYLIEKEKLEELFKKRAVYEAALKEQLSGQPTKPYGRISVSSAHHF